MMSAVINSFTLDVLLHMCERNYTLVVMIYAVMGLFAIVVVLFYRCERYHACCDDVRCDELINLSI